MNGISTAISKSCCPVYSFGSSSKINFGTNDKINNFGTSKKMEDLIPGRLSNLPHLRITPLIVIKPLLKHRAYSCKDITTGSMSKAPEVSGSVTPYGLLGLYGIIGLALPKAWEVVAQSISTRGGTAGVIKSIPCYSFIFLGVAAVFVARSFLGNILRGFAVLRDKPFSTKDIIQVGCLKGQVIQMGLITTSLVTSENQYVQVPTSWFYGQVIVNKSWATTTVPHLLRFGQLLLKLPWAPLHEMVTKIYLERDMKPKLLEIINEIDEVLESNSNIYLEEERNHPYVELSRLRSYCELDIICYLKPMSEDELYLAKQDVLLQTIQRVKKFGAKVGGHKVQVKSL